MKKIVQALLISAAIVGVAHAQTVYVDGKPVDQKIIDQAMGQLKKNPMAAQQLNNPQFKQEMLQSIGMQQAIVIEGNGQGLDKSAEYLAKLNEIKPMVYAQILQEKATNQPVTDAQIKAKYDQAKEAAAKQQQYKVSHILVKDQKTANDIEAQLKKGAKFADLAKKYSTDPGSKNNGGELGWSDGSNYVPEFTAGFKNLKKGEYTTTPIKTQFGFHIIELVDVKSGGSTYPAYDKVKDQIKQQIQMERTRAFFDGIKAKHKVQVK